MSEGEVPAFTLPRRYPHTDSLLARAAAPGPIRRTAETTWAAMMKSPSRAGFQLTHHLRKARRRLRGWERRLVAAGLYALVRSHRLLAAMLGVEVGDARLWVAWLATQGLPVDEAIRHTGLATLERFHALEDAARGVLEGMEAVDQLGVAASLPGVVAQRLLADLGEQALGVALASNQRAPLVLRVNPRRTRVDTIVTELQALEIEAHPHPLIDTAVVLAQRTDVRAQDAYLRGDIEIQDAGSQCLGAFAAVRPGERVVDYCAGAGGKTLGLADALGPEGELWAWDLHAAKLERLRPRLQRWGAEPVVHIGELPPEGTADCVFVDAPCSGSGTLRREPCLRWRLTDARVSAMHATQVEVLAAAARLVRPGGRLVYGTCSLFRAENQETVAAFLRRHPGYRQRNEVLNLRPDVDDTDGFYGVSLECSA